MPCPYFSRDKNDCLLVEESGNDDEEDAGVAVADPVARDWCLADRAVYRTCPIFRRHLADLVR
jgi:hypothetical protein